MTNTFKYILQKPATGSSDENTLSESALYQQPLQPKNSHSNRNWPTYWHNCPQSSGIHRLTYRQQFSQTTWYKPWTTYTGCFTDGHVLFADKRVSREHESSEQIAGSETREKSSQDILLPHGVWRRSNPETLHFPIFFRKLLLTSYGYDREVNEDILVRLQRGRQRGRKWVASGEARHRRGRADSMLLS